MNYFFRVDLMSEQMTHQANRRSFLRGRFNETPVMRPPGAVEAEAFAALCTKCDACAKACPESIILSDSEGFPKVDLTLNACTFCGVCAQVCEPEAILPATGWAWRAQPTRSCLSVQGITCRTCEDQCDSQAIRFRLLTGGRSEAQFDSDLCIGCGACAAACPAGAISFHEIQQPSEEQPC